MLLRHDEALVGYLFSGVGPGMRLVSRVEDCVRMWRVSLRGKKRVLRRREALAWE